MFGSFKQETNVDTNFPISGTHEPSDGGVFVATGVQLGTRGISCVITHL